MNNQKEKTAAVLKELARVRELKRNAEATIELLRSDTEKGKIHLRVNTDENFREKLAKAIVDESHPGYNGMGYYYADPVEGQVYYRESNAAWNPWNENDSWRIISVNDFIDPVCDFNPQIEDWREALGDELFNKIQQAWLEENDPDLDDSIPEMIAWASEHPEYDEIISDAEEDAEREAISFALSEIKDEIVVNVVNINT